nr:immunoglobulin light chain junction region [Macaca mulatta]
DYYCSSYTGSNTLF